jgi:hypothetical protein
MDLGKKLLGVVDWICLAQDGENWRTFGKAVMNLRVPENTRKLSSVYITGGLSSGAQLHRIRNLPTIEMRSVVLADGMCEVRKAKREQILIYVDSYISASINSRLSMLKCVFGKKKVCALKRAVASNP